MKKLITLINLLALCVTTLFAQAPEKFTYQAVVRNASNQLVTNAPVGVQVSVLQGGVAGTLVYMETHTSVTNDNGLLTLAIGGGNLQQGDFASIDWANGPYFLKTEIDPAGGTNYSITSVQQLLSVPYALYSKEAGNGFSGDYNDLTNLPQIPQNVSELTNDAGYITMDSVPTIPTNISAFTNDAGYLTGYTETDPQFNAWDKDYNDLINKPTIPTVPENVSAFTNDAGYITMDSVPTNVSAFTNDVGYITMDSVPTNVSAYTNDAGYLTSFTEQQILSISNDTIFLTGGSFVKLPAGFDGDYNSLSNKPELFSGDYNDLTNQPTIPTIPTNVSVFNNDAGYITMDSVPTNVSTFSNDAGYITMDSVPTIPTNVSTFANDAGYITGYTETDPQFNAWDKDYNDLTNKPVNADFGHGIVRTNVNNPSGATDIAVTFTGYSLMNGGVVSLGFTRNVPAGATLNINNKGAKMIRWKGTALTDGIIKAGDRCLFMYNSGNESYYLLANDRWGVDIDALAAVARTGSYNDLSDKPEIPTVPTNVSAFTNDVGYLTGYTETDPEFNAWDKDYNDLINQPTIPTVPENVSAFINDAGYITMDSVPTIPTNVSSFANDAGYITGYTETDPQFNAWDKDYNDLTNKPVNADFGHGIVRTNVNNPSGVTDIAVTFTGYSLMNGGVVSLGFTRNVPAGATLNINNKGAKMIRWKGTALTDGIIKAGDRCLFMYNSGNESYYLLANDRWGVDIDALAAVARTGSYNDLSDKPEIPTVPTNVSAFTNDAGYLTGYTETDPEFNAWDKDYNDLINQPTIPTVPENVSAFINDAGYITMDSVPSIPTNVSTFANDAGYITGYTETDPQFNAWDKDYNDLTNKPNLATVATTGNYNDLTNTPNLAPVATTGNYNDLTNTPNLAPVATTGSYNDLINTPTIPTVPTNVSAFVNDAGYLTAIPDGIGGISIESDPVFSAWNKDYNDLTNKPNLATVATTGNYNDLTNKPNLAPVATTGSYNDLTNTPTIPAAQVNADWNATMGVAQILNKPNLFSGNYNDLTNRPTIPTVPTNVSAFTNDAGYITAADVPAQVNADWNATSGVARILNKPTIPTIPSNVSAFSNDAHYITNTGNTCENTIDLCNLLNTIENLQNQVQELANMAGGSPYGTASSDTCPRHIVMIDGNPNACYYGFNTLNITLVAWVDGNVDMDATYTWYESGQSLDGQNYYLMGSWEPTYNNPYIFTVEVTKSDGCSYVSAPFEVNVYDKPYATITGSDNEICTGESVSLRANLQNYNDPMITFQWYENQDDNSHALPGRTHEIEDFSPASTTDYIVKVTHLMDYSYESCVAYDTFRVEVTECDTAGGGGTDTTQTSQHTISISLTTDNWGSETSWQVTDVSNNTILASGGPYSSNSTQEIPDIIVDGMGCYVFTIYDSYGDGISSNGNYSVSYDSVVMGSGGGNSFSQVSYILNPESSSCPSDEISLTSLNISSYQALNNNFQIKGKVTNNGANAIISFKVKYRVDGGAWSSDYSVSCNIVPMGTLNFTHDIPASIASTGQHTIDVMVYEPNGNADDETDNSISMNVEVSGIPDGDAQPCPGSHTISDIDNNVYNTVQIGSQCWLAENLRATRYADGSDIPLGTDTSSTTAYRYYPSNNANNVHTYGYLYNWRAVMHNSTSSTVNPSGVQGVCPTGWHVPSDAEWTQLTSYVKGHSAYFCNDSNRIAKALAGTTEWYNSSNECAVGNDLSSNNTAGFNVKPAGFYGYSSFRSYAYIWSATEASNSNAYNRYLNSNNATVYRNSGSKFYGYSVRCLRDDNSISAFPTVTTDTVSNVTDTSATCGGSVTAGSGTTVTDRGVCWSTSPNPSLADNHTSNGSGTGSFISNLTDVEPYHIIYVRAYATTTYGTVYGNEVSFSTVVNPNGDSLSCPETPIIMDIDGNYYNTVQIGGQCWMRENLRTMNYADGTPVPQIDNTVNGSTWHYPNNDESNKVTYGLLYNWHAVMRGASSSNATPSGVQGVCPDGWHVPSNVEWNMLSEYVKSQSEYLCGNNSNNIGKALASTQNWNNSTYTCSVGNNPSENNATGFGAVPAGICDDNAYSNYGLGTNVMFMSTWEFGSRASNVTMSNTRSAITFDSQYKRYGGSVRCLRNGGQSQFLPTVTTGNITNITTTSVSGGGSVTVEGPVAVTSRGVCWSTRHYPTKDDAFILCGSGTGSFTGNITDLSSNLTYYVRAFATTQYGTVYGNEVSFITTVNPNGDGFSCPGTPTVTDFDGNIYNTVQIGGQCWMRENLRTTHYADGTPAGQNGSLYNWDSYSYTTDYWYYPSRDSSYKESYGLLYNWSAVMNGEASSDGTPSGVQGICPTGWHVPSDAEWTLLINYMNGQSEYLCNNTIAKALANKTGWSKQTYSCSAGYNPEENNASGFGALPAGCYHGYSSEPYTFSGQASYFWSATEQSGNDVNVYGLYSSDISREVNNIIKYNGFSIRCVLDNGQTQFFPSVTTSPVSNISSTSVTCGGNVTSAGGAPVTARGLCWSTQHNPSVEDNQINNGSGTGSFSNNITGLVSNITYYVRAYATNQYGTVYGAEVSFTTPINPNGDEHSCQGTPTVTDIDGNVYNTVQIGGQCWLRENLKTTRYSDGTSISQGNSSSTTVGYWNYPNDDPSTKQTYGLLYNWSAVMGESFSTDAIPSGVQGICPTGWHVPSDAEWTVLSDYLGNYGGNNISFFSAILAGYGYNDYNDGGFGNYAYFWSTTEHGGSSAFCRYLYYDGTNISRVDRSKYYRQSVRCLRNEDDASLLPTVTTKNITNIGSSTATCGGNVTATGGATVTARGVCWSITPHPTVKDFYTTNGSGSGNFNSSLTGLVSNITYYVRAYATNSYGTVYGNEVSFTIPVNPNGDALSCPGAATVTDVDGNVYNTVKIGNQCWMRDNLRTMKYADGTPISQGSYSSLTTAYWRYPNSDSTTKQPFGLLYNWKAVLGAATTSDAIPSGVQGICPTGWHVPSSSEWSQLTTYVSGQSGYVCGNNNAQIAKALAFTSGWENSTYNCAVGNGQTSNNATGFGAMATGYYDGSYDRDFGYYTYLWSSTGNGDSRAYTCYLYYSNKNVGLVSSYSSYYHPVRCLRD